MKRAVQWSGVLGVSCLIVMAMGCSQPAARGDRSPVQGPSARVAEQLLSASYADGALAVTKSDDRCDLRFLDRFEGHGEFFGTCGFRNLPEGSRLTIAFMDEWGRVIDSYTERGIDGSGMVKVFLPVDSTLPGEVVLRLEQTHSPEQS